ncbi:GM22109 [Drosophila sechellia]|uniref:GM22109 n=1 Tax=Drosophila sechellia TaxID=7238 RepID=B4IAV9_DROSE|nr:GM22109 [Drosophila sechellia]
MLCLITYEIVGEDGHLFLASSKRPGTQQEDDGIALLKLQTLLFREGNVHDASMMMLSLRAVSFDSHSLMMDKSVDKRSIGQSDYDD